MPSLSSPSLSPCASSGVTLPSRRRAGSAVLRREPARGTPCPVELAEAELVARLRKGDEAAFEVLVRTYGPRMLTVAHGYVPSPQDAEDVLQSAFVLVFRFVHRFEGGSRLSTWLHRIVVNCALMKLRSRARHPEVRLDASPGRDDASGATRVGSSVVRDLERREAHERLSRALARLPDADGAAIRLRDVDGHSLAETALLMDRSASAVKVSLQRGRVALRRLLSAGGELALG